MPTPAAELVRSSLQGNLAKVRKLLDSGVDVNCSDEHGMGPLLTFTPAVIELLLERGADPNRQQNENGAPVLCGIAYLIKVDCVRLLLAGGADPNGAHAKTGETALHSCLSKPGQIIPEAARVEVVKLLLAAGADPNHRTTPGVSTFQYWRDVRTRGETPLHRAAAYGCEETVQLLLNAGGDRSLRDETGDSPQSWASWHWRPKTLIDLLAPDPHK
jgi:uncharacterized protein